MSDKKRILITDDEQDILEMLSDLLSSELDVECVKALDGLDAYMKACEEKFDLIISDYKMPHMNGVQFLKALREKENPNQSTSLIFISGFIPELEKEHIDDVILLEKPVELDRLIKMAKMHIFSKD